MSQDFYQINRLVFELKNVQQLFNTKNMSKLKYKLIKYKEDK